MRAPVPTERERMPYVQIDTNVWAVMREPKDRPAAMILGLANRDNVPLFFVMTWHPDPAKRRVVSQHDTLEAANGSVLWDNRVADISKMNAGPPNGASAREPNMTIQGVPSPGTPGSLPLP